MTDITLQEVTVISTETVQEDGTETPTNLITTGKNIPKQHVMRCVFVPINSSHSTHP